ncbi:MAG: hypothetical protein ACI89X_003605 [Planctomycetota bacterium]|jgi:hypothetical protein
MTLKLSLVGALLLGSPLVAQSPGLRLISPTGLNQTELVDGQGAIVHTWPGTASTSITLLDDGTLLRAIVVGSLSIPGETGQLQQMDLAGTVLWDFVVASPTRAMHHDIEPLPNGNVLVIVWDIQVPADAIAAGRDPALISGTRWLPDSILEIQRTGPATGSVVWEWHVIDHVIQDFDVTKPNYGVVANHPELLDINYPPVVLTDGDWNHANGLDYEAANDWIVLSSRSQDEIYLIDHSTTTAEAAGHVGGQRGMGGDLLYRWGNPAAYDSGTLLDKRLNGQHDPRFIRPGLVGAGNLTVFNNVWTLNQSSVYEIVLPLDPAGNPELDPVTGIYGPFAPLWTFSEAGFYSQFVSGAERLANGNTLICSGMQKRVFEVTPAGQTVWSYTHPGTGILFQAHSVDRSQWSGEELSVSGGQVDFDYLVDSSLAGHTYLLLGSFSGGSPGSLLPGGVTLPLNTDFLTIGMLQQPNVGVFVDTLGTIGTLGEGSSSIILPAGLVPAALVGVNMDFAHVIFDPLGFVMQASNRTTVTFTL